MSTMLGGSWADSVADVAGGEVLARQPAPAGSRPTRSCYVPPHLRMPLVEVQNPAAVDALPVTVMPPGGGRHRRGRGGRGRDREMSVVDAVEKMGELEISESGVIGRGGGGGVGGGVSGGSGGINFDAYEDIPVETSGEDVPPPVATFAEIDLGKAVSSNIVRCRYVKPTPVQRHAIPIAVAGRDLMACAQTGSGKTAAFCFPIISGIMKNGARPPSSFSRGGGRGYKMAYPLALILSPTRELACQIHEEAKKFAYQTGVKVVVVYGGAPINQQLWELEKGVDILVATPGRLVDLVERARVSLQRIKYLTLDEADRMLDMGFEPQIRKIVQQLDMPRPRARQTMLFSATFPSEIQRLASDFLSNYIFLAVGRVGSSTDLISQRVEFVQEMEKRSTLMELLHTQANNGSHGRPSLTLVFVETKRGANTLENWLSRNGFPATAIHGDKTQPEREQALRSFKSGATPILVATDVAARGLDIPHVAHVVNFDLPKDIDDYVHRIGRTGRAGKSGLATAFFTEANQPLAKSLVVLMQEANQEVPLWLTQHASRPTFGGGRSRRFGANRFGDRDYRKDTAPHHKGGWNHQSNHYASSQAYRYGTVYGAGGTSDVGFGGGYSAGATNDGGYDAGATNDGGYGAGATNDGGYGAGATNNGGYGAGGSYSGGCGAGSCGGYDGGSGNTVVYPVHGYENIAATGWD